MFCEKCGSEMSDTAMFCPKCGHKRNADINKGANPSVEDIEKVKDVVNAAHTHMKENPQLTKYMFLGIIILVLIIVLSVVLKHKNTSSDEDFSVESFEQSENENGNGGQTSSSATEFVDEFLNALLTYNADKVRSYYASEAPYNSPQLEEELARMYQMSKEHQKIWFDYEMPSTSINKSGYDEAYDITVTVYKSEYEYGGTAETYWPEQLVIGRKGDTWYVLEQMYVIYMPDWRSYRD